ncbi:ATP-binding cassette domain-containing protein [Candidatus Pelagibacter sp.]|nr:ATP-binding cassette domain-containing protein [Candidatus Pelagibacter sp.]
MAIIKKFRIKSFKENKPLIKLEKISLSFGKRQILDNISFSINSGEILGMLGPNGVGKSTLFNLIIGLLKPDFGSIIVNGENVLDYPISERTKKFKIGYVPQYGGYFHDLTLLDNLKAVSEVLIDNKSDRNSKIDYLISRFELDSVLNIQAKFLSGGQKKKLVIAMALMSDPKVLLLDECFAALDVMTIKMLQELIVSLQSEKNICICICDHQARDLLSCVDVAIVMSNCKIVAKGTPSMLINDSKAKTAYFGNSFKIN